MAFLLVLAAGFLGGMLSSFWFTPTLPPLTKGSDQLVATVQEVTISPSKAMEELVLEQQGSVLLLGQVEGDTIRPVAVGAVVTNDGIVVTPTLPGQQVNDLQAFDGEHEATALSLLGRDEVYGLTYYRLNDGVLTPLDLAQTDPAVGGQLLEISRDGETTLPLAFTAGVEGYQLPEADQPKGWQRIMTLGESSAQDNSLAGSVLLTDEGALGAIRIPAEATAVPVTIIQESLQRLTRQEREFDALESWGLELDYDFQYVETERRNQFVVTVTGVAPNSSADRARLRVGDRITTVGDSEVSWDVPVVPLFAGDNTSLKITRQRGNSTEDVVLTKSPPPSS